MKILYLIRHGESSTDTLTFSGEAQVRIAIVRWLSVWDRGSVRVLHSPTGRTKETARLFCKETGLVSEDCPLLHIAKDHDRPAHVQFAELVAGYSERNIVLIGHDESRKQLEATVRRLVGRQDKTQELGEGEMIRFTEWNGFEYF